MRVLRAGAKAGAWTFGLLALLIVSLTLLPFVRGDEPGGASVLDGLGWAVVLVVGFAIPVALIVAVARGAWALFLDESLREHRHSGS